VTGGLAGIPPDYYRRLEAVDEEHWWYVGMREIAAALLGPRLVAPDQSLLDAGCGAGGFLAWAAGLGSFTRVCGIDVSTEAIELARARVPEAELHVGPLHELPFEREAFDLAVCLDVLQHLHEDELERSLRELRRVLRPSGTLLVRTGGARRHRRERDDWRIFDRDSLSETLERAGFRVERITYVNAGLSLLASARGRSPRAPTEHTSGVPERVGRLQSTVGTLALGLEARYLRRVRGGLPYGHSIAAVACPLSDRDTGWERSVIGFWDEEALRYDAAYDAQNARGRLLRARRDLMVRLLDGEAPGRVLDVGMGGGRLCIELARRGWEVSGLDVSKHMVELARRRLPEAAERLRCGTMAELPFRDGSFDAVVASGSLEYADDLGHALTELARVLRPGGSAVVSFPDHSALSVKVRARLIYPAVRLAKRALPFGRPAPLRRGDRLSPSDFERAMTAAGFAVNAVEAVDSQLVVRARLSGSPTPAI
jgi:ubiquinone/menaquinone biosynthesis C-methylase UbiE